MCDQGGEGGDLFHLLPQVNPFCRRHLASCTARMLEVHAQLGYVAHRLEVVSLAGVA